MVARIEARAAPPTALLNLINVSFISLRLLFDLKLVQTKEHFSRLSHSATVLGAKRPRLALERH
jgi:hypothetical protein